ncbi:class I SAM-dependent methyltransferase [Hydrogenophaga sp. 2FB]|uniref:class I SAM-dependent methyltransferase n=1 Tax=Hydrogenophaga sp. 2FB TaxID=2502187 RepID=UPI0010F6C84A|nr:class I SAM-dependent methyltransferase [Hydrogenophaga sp. 2FB]
MSRKETFSADWLQQREPFDSAARNGAAGRMQLLSRLTPPQGSPWRVIDLACGTGANLRWLAPRLGGPQQWLMVDHDAALLRRIPWDFSGAGFQASTVRQQTDLARQLDTLPWHAAHLVTASALLDLVSAEWLQRLVAHAIAARAALLFALSVDGRHQWTPQDPHDATVDRLFRAHQRRDKGFGPALGADAIAACRRALRAAGYRVFTTSSDWVLDGHEQPQAAALQRALIGGMAAAAREQDPASQATLQAWCERRQAAVADSRLRVGHVDLLALPPH